MANPIARFEAGDTRQWTVGYSSAPTTTPRLSIFAGSGNGICVVSLQLATASSATDFYTFWTLPASRLIYAYAWVASFTGAGPVVIAGMFQVLKTTAE